MLEKVKLERNSRPADKKRINKAGAAPVYLNLCFYFLSYVFKYINSRLANTNESK